MEPSDLVDRPFGPHSFRICHQNVADFVAATGDDAGRWVEAAPPGFLAATLFVVAPDLLGQFPERSVIHGEQTFTWHRLLVVETDVRVTGTVSRVRERGGVSFVDFDLVVEDDHDLLAEGTSMFLLSGSSAAVSGIEEKPEPDPLDDGGPGPGQVSASRADLVRYAAATRDWNPIHWDHQAAVEAGVSGVIVHGLLQASWALAAASRLRDGLHPFSSARVRFRNPLLPATPVELEVKEGEGEATVSVGDGETEYVNARVVMR